MATLDTNLQGSLILTQPSNTIVTLDTANTYVSKDITLSLSVQTGALTVSGGGLTAGAGSASLSANAGYKNGNSYDTNDKIILTSTEASGYYKLVATGSGTVNRAAITKQVTTAGWLAADATTVSVVDSTSLASNTQNTNYYIKKSTTTGNTTITPNNSTQTVTLSDGYYPSERVITINAISETSAVATFSNTATSGVTYTDYSNSAPVIPSGGYLYINAGYTPSRKISLAKLVPDNVTIGTTTQSPYIHPSHTAYNQDGEVVTGTMVLYSNTRTYTVTTS